MDWADARVHLKDSGPAEKLIAACGQGFTTVTESRQGDAQVSVDCEECRLAARLDDDAASRTQAEVAGA